MSVHVAIEGGFAEVGAGQWLMGRSQPAAFFGSAVRRRRRGWCVRDRSRLDLVEVGGRAKCSDAARPFLTHIPCAAPVFAVSEKVLVAPSDARRDAQFVKAIPMSLSGSVCVTEFGEEWVVMATASRTCRMPLEDGQTLSARPDAVVAWTTRRPTGFCPKLSFLDVVLPRGPRDLLLTFYGPGVVWVEGSGGPRCFAAGRSRGSVSMFGRRAYGV